MNSSERHFMIDMPSVDDICTFPTIEVGESLTVTGKGANIDTVLNYFGKINRINSEFLITKIEDGYTLLRIK